MTVVYFDFYSARSYRHQHLGCYLVSADTRDCTFMPFAFKINRDHCRMESISSDLLENSVKLYSHFRDSSPGLEARLVDNWANLSAFDVAKKENWKL